MPSPTPRRDPAPSVVELDGWSLQRLEPEHAGLVVQLLGQRGNRFVLDMPLDEASIGALLRDLPHQPWSLPLAAVRDGACVGVGTTALANLKSLHASFMALFVDPPASAVPLSMLVRHLFWTFPLHRLHTQIPLMDLTREYVDLFLAVGFEDEGRLVEHALIGGQRFDVVALGLRRSTFERWCGEHEPRLALS